MADYDVTFDLNEGDNINATFDLIESNNIDCTFIVGEQDYNYNYNKPQINGVILQGNKTSADLSLASAEDLQNEATTRANNDTLLQNDINTLTTNLNAEISDRTTADTTLSNEISQEASNREDADEELQEQITANHNNFDNYRTSANQDVIDASKQDVISDLSTIRSNASAGKSASDTIATYGNIVTHNISEFATSNQGSLADTALQPNDNISELTNDVGYITSAYHDNTKQDTLTAGSNIQINNNVISATDTTYTAGNGLTLTGTEFSANVTDNVTSTSTTNALSANMGKELQAQIDNLKARGRYLSQWNSATGLAETQPTILPYDYKAGDYFIVGTMGETNYKPNGSQYTGVASTTIETSAVAIEDVYYYDGSIWHLQQNTQKTVSFANLAGQPTDNTNLASALNAKQDILTAGSNIQITDNTISATDTTYTAGTDIEITNNTISFTGTIPTKTSDLTNDSDFITSSYHDSTKYDASNPNGYTSNEGTITGITMNGSSKGTSGVVDLGTVITSTSDCVHLTGAETVSGTKTFTGNPVFSNTTYGQSLTIKRNANGNSSITFENTNGTQGTIAFESNGNIPCVTIGSGATTKQNLVRNSTFGTAVGSSSQPVYVNSSGVATACTNKIWTGTLAQYNALSSKDANTLYNITDDLDVTLTLLQTIYPVGSLYLTTNSTCPLASLFGTWELVSKDKVLQGAGTRGTVGSSLGESLPNIKGTFGNTTRMSVSDMASRTTGVFTYTNQSVPSASASNSDFGGYVSFNASNSSSTYQDNAPVQQDAYLINVYRRTA